MKDNRTIHSVLAVEETLEFIRGDLEKVEVELAEQFLGRGIDAVVPTFSAAGCIRLRPALHLLAARLCGCEDDAAVRLGAVLELMHLAIGAHEGVTDRCGSPFGRFRDDGSCSNSLLILGGDWLWLQAFRLAFSKRHFRILTLLIGTAKIMVEGEMMQFHQRGRLNVTETEVLEAVTCKTARLFGLSMQLGAVLAGRDQAVEDCLLRCGMHLGLAFQVITDLLNMIGPSRAPSRPMEMNLPARRVNLPLVYLLEKSNVQAHFLIKEMLSGKPHFLTTRQRIAALVRDSGAFGRTWDLASRSATEVFRCLHAFPDSQCRRALQTICEHILALADLERPGNGETSPFLRDLY